MAFHVLYRVGTPNTSISRLNSPACTCPYRRFATPSRDVDARLGVTVGRYPFGVELFHLLPHAGSSRRFHKMAKHFTLDIGDATFTYQRNQTRIQAEAALDGIYVIRTDVPADTLDAAGAVVAYKNLAGLERDWRNIKTDDLDLRPIHHYLTGRVEAHLLICMLAQYLTWHLRRAWAPLTYTDEHPPTRDNPVTAATRSDAATTKARTKTDPDDNPIRSFRDLLDHLATLTRNAITFGDRHLNVLATPTPTQRRAFELINTPIPLTLT